MTTLRRVWLGFGTLTALLAAVCVAVVAGGPSAEGLALPLMLAAVVVAVATGVAVRRAVMRGGRAVEEARAYAENVVTTVREPLLVLNADLRVVTASRSFHQTFRLAAGETQGRLLYDLGDGQWDIPALRTLLLEVLPRSTVVTGYEVEHEFPGLGKRTMVLDARRIQREGERCELTLLAIEDITERKRAEAGLRESEAFSRSLMEGSTDCIKVLDLDGRLLAMNGPGLCAMEIDDFSPMCGQSWTALWPAEAKGEVERAVANARGGAASSFQAYCPTARGTPRWWEVAVSPVRNAPDGRIVRLLSVSRDITGRKRAEERLQASEERFRTLFESMDEGFCVIEFFDGPHGPLSDYVHVLANPAYTANAGIPDIVGQKVREMVPDEADAWVEVYRNVLVSGQPVRFERELVATGRHLELAAFRVEPPERRQVAVLFKDVSARKRAEEQLREKRERLRVTLASIGDAVVTTDTAGLVTNLNPVAESLTGWKLAEAMGQPLDAVFNVVNEETRAGVESPATRALREGVVVGLANHTILIAKDGTERPIDDSAAPIRSEQGEVIGCVLVFRDISERRRAEEALRASEERFRFVRQSSGVGFWYCDLPFGVLQWDEHVKAHFHLPPDAAVTIDTFYERIHPDDRGPTRTAIERSISDRVPYDVDYRTVDPATGAQRWVRAIGRTFYDTDGTPTRFDGVTLDVTDRRRADDALRESERRYRLVGEAANDAIWDWDLVTNRVAWNEGVRRVYGYAEGQVGSDASWWLENIHPDDRDRIAHDIHAAIGGGVEFWTGEYRFRRADGSFAAVFDRGRVVRDDGRPVRMVGSMLDLTERKRLEDELRQVAAELSEADRRKDEFLAVLAHELRNPLAPIRSALQIMKLTDQRGPREEARTLMERQLEQMVRLVDDLMDVSRITRGKVELRKERVQLSAVVNSAVETSRPLVEQMGHELTVSLHPQPVILDADPTRLAQVFSNLLNNAAKYSERGGRIRLTAERRGSEVVVSVKDTGIGIPADKLTSIFDMFSQVDRSLEKAQGGLGIGLTLVKRLTEMHGGTVEARSEGAGRGSEFVVRLPVVAEAPASKRDGDRGDPSAPRSSLRILIVDDNRDGADSLAMMLGLMGNDTRTAYDGREGVEVAEKVRPDVVLFDIGLPKLNGYEACRRIRGQAWGKNVVLIAVTGWGQDEDRRRSQEAGFDHHLVKPVDPNALMTLLAGLSEAEKG